MFAPESGTLIFVEGVGTPGTTVTWVSELSTLEITEVTWDVINSDPEASPLEEFTGLDVTWLGSSFTFASTFATWFSRRTTFVNEEGVVGLNMTYSFDNQVARPSLLPPEYLAAHRVESPPRFLTLVFTIVGVETTLGTEGGTGPGGEIIPPVPPVSGSYEQEWTCIVQSNYDANITAVRYAVENSDGYKRYQGS